MNLQARVVNILTRPAAEWPIIASEPTDVASLYTNYIGILAAIPAVCTFAAFLLIGGMFGATGGLTFAFMAGLSNYIGALVSAFVAAFIIEKLAPTFDSRGDTAQALKMVAYASTPVWVAGVLHLIPLLSVFIILAVVYAVYLFYLGLPPVMKTPKDKIVPYMIVSAVVVILVSFLIGAILAVFTGASMGAAMYGGRAF